MIVAGFMSGTSMDALDCSIVDIFIDSNLNLNYKIIAKESFLFDESVINQIISYIGCKDKVKIDKIDNFLGKEFLRLSRSFLSLHHFDYISIHGQTIYHKNKVKSVQVGNPCYLGDYFNVPVIYNFRLKDIKSKGTGAPLMPFLDWLIFKKDTDGGIMTLNLGGISNISYIMLNKKDVLGFDTGPGMCLIDQCVKKLWNESYDFNGEYSSYGTINKSMLNYLIDNCGYILSPPPKSTGREEFGEDYFNQIYNQYRNLNKFDLLRTFVKFTSQVIKLNVEKFILKNHRVNKLIISGGGVYNTTLVNDIKKDLDIPVFNIIDYGIEPKMKESLLMSILGYAKVNNINSNMPSVTGASNDVVLGEIYEPK